MPQGSMIPFVLGQPVKSPADFFGREEVLGELFQAVLSSQPIAVVGEHRCGNTSVIYQMNHPEVRERFLSPEQEDALLFALISCPLATGGPRALLRRISRTLRRADPEANVDFKATADRVWLEDYLEDLADRDRRLVLLMDEFEVLADYDEEFWEWFEGLVNAYNISMVVTTRRDLGRFRAEVGKGPPFFNLFHSLYIGSFKPETVGHFLQEKSVATDFDFPAMRDVIEDLAGRFPYYLQLAAALFYIEAGGERTVSDKQVDSVRREFALRTGMLFDDAWRKLPETEREALTWLAMDKRPPDERAFERAVAALERRGYVVDGRVFSSAFADYVRHQHSRIRIDSETDAVRIERRVIDLSPKAYAMLRHFLEHEDEVVSSDALLQAVWPEYREETHGEPETLLAEVLGELKETIEVGGTDFEHIEHLSGKGYRFRNTQRALE